MQIINNTDLIKEGKVTLPLNYENRVEINQTDTIY
jgi:hypothetical protein